MAIYVQNTAIITMLSYLPTIASHPMYLQ